MISNSYGRALSVTPVTILPARLAEQLNKHLVKVKALHERDLSEGFGRVNLHDALSKKYPNANQEWGWQFVFPATRRAKVP